MDEIQFLLRVIIGGLICSGLYFCINYDGAIFEWFGILLDKLPKFISKPLGSCLVCMASFYGTDIYILFKLVNDEPFYFDLQELIPFFMYILALSGFNYIVSLFELSNTNE